MPIRLLSSLGAAAVAAALAFATPALASSAAFGAGRLVRGAHTKSSLFMAGYESNAPSATAVSVTTTLVVPAVRKCRETKQVIIPAVGARGASESSAAVGLDIHCRNRKVIYFPIFSADGKLRARASAHAHPGDTIVLRLSWNATSLSLAVVDKTHPSVTRKLTGMGSSSFSEPSIVDAIIGNPPAPVPDFGTVTFRKSKINGLALGRVPKLRRYNLVNSSDVLQIKTGPIASNDESFATMFKHS